MTLFAAAVGGSSNLGTMVVLSLWPVALAIPYASRPRLLRLVLFSVVVFTVSTFVSTLAPLFPSAYTDAMRQRVNAAIVPFFVALYALSLWQLGSRLREALTEMREANRALAESERGLERKVATRTRELAAKVAEISDINEVARTVNSTLDLDRVVAAVNAGLQKVFRFDQLAVFLLDEDRRRLVLDRLEGNLDEKLAARLRGTGIPMDEEGSTLVGVARNREPVFLPTITSENVQSLSPSDQIIYDANPLRALLICPLEIQDRVIGCIFFGHTREPFELGEADIETVQRYVTPLATGIANARLFEEAREARSAAEQANQAKSEFLASMSHELRTPLNAIIGYGEMLQEEAREAGQEDFLPDLDKILGSGRYLLELINSVLDLSKVEAGKMDVYLESFDVVQLIRGVAGTVQPLIQKQSNSLEVRSAENLGSMRSDVTKIRQALFNLLSNAS